MLAGEVISSCAEVFQDVNYQAVSIAQWIGWINDAQRVVSQIRPEASVSTASFQLVAGTKQSIPSTARRLVDLVRNMGSNGTTPGKSIRGPVVREDMDGMDYSWHTKTAAEVSEYSYNVNRPAVFYVNPGVTGTLWVEAELAVIPVSIVSQNDNLSVNDIYGPAMIEWCLYRAFSRDSELTPNVQRAQAHIQAFMALMQIKSASDLEIHPKVTQANA
jgi:hypothetical protein